MSIINYNEKRTASIVYKYSFCSTSAPIFLFFDKSSNTKILFLKSRKILQSSFTKRRAPFKTYKNHRRSCSNYIRLFLLYL